MIKISGIERSYECTNYNSWDEQIKKNKETEYLQHRCQDSVPSNFFYASVFVLISLIALRFSSHALNLGTYDLFVLTRSINSGGHQLFAFIDMIWA